MKDIFRDFTHQGRRIIQLGLFVVFAWMISYMLLAVLNIGFRLSATTPFLAFGVLCCIVGLMHRKRKARPVLTPMEEICLSLLSLEMLAAAGVLAYVLFLPMGKATAYIIAFSVLSSMAVSIAVFYSYYLKARKKDQAFGKHLKKALSIAMVMHLLWAFQLPLL